MAFKLYENAVLCDETPFYGLRWYLDKDKDGKWEMTLRLYEARLQVNEKKMAAYIDPKLSPGGVQVLWSHAGGITAVGRVMSAGFVGTALRGDLKISDEELKAYMPGGTDSLDERINAGLSVGMTFIDNPPFKWKMREGTKEKPDLLQFQGVRVIEVSLTPVPRLYTAGLQGPGTILGEKPNPMEGMTNE